MSLRKEGDVTGEPLPRYVQISEMLIRDIAAGRRADGSRLPPERRMAVELGVSVGTLRKALDMLAERGLLNRVQGSGNYVKSRASVPSVYAMFRLEKVGGGGGLPTAEVLSVDLLAKPEAAPPFGPSADGHRIRRLRRLDGEPVAVEEIWLDGGWAAALEPAELSESLYLHYRTALGLVIGQAEDRIGLGTVPDWAPAGFGPRPGAAAPLVERVSRAQTGELAEFSLTWFDNDKARYVSRLGKG